METAGVDGDGEHVGRPSTWHATWPDSGDTLALRGVPQQASDAIALIATPVRTTTTPRKEHATCQAAMYRYSA